MIIVYQSRPWWRRLIYFFLKGIAGGVMAFSVLGILFWLSPWIKQEFLFYSSRHQETKISAFGLLLTQIDQDARAQAEKEAKELGVDDTYFSLVIPKIGAKSTVVSNVDAGNEEEYQQALQRGIAHARGTAFPGMGRLIYLFAHSTDSLWNVGRYNAVFYLLRKLEPGDEIIVFFTGKIFRYRVFQKLTVDPKDINWLQKQKAGEVLILQTCWPPGTIWQRLLVLARPI